MVKIVNISNYYNTNYSINDSITIGFVPESIWEQIYALQNGKIDRGQNSVFQFNLQYRDQYVREYAVLNEKRWVLYEEYEIAEKVFDQEEKFMQEQGLLDD